VDWELRLNDAISGPAARAAAALKPVEDGLRDVNRQLASSAIDKMNDGLKKQQAQLRLQRTDLAANLRAAKAQEAAEARVQRVQSQARASAAREERVKRRAAEAQARVEARAQASAQKAAERSAAAKSREESKAQAQSQRAQAQADRASQRMAQDRARVNEGVRRREVAALAASAREGQRREAAAQRASNAQVAAQNRSRIAAENRAQRDIARAAQQAERDKAKATAGVQANADRQREGSGIGMMDLGGQVGLLMKIGAAAALAAAAVAKVGYEFSKAVLSAVDFRASSIKAIDTLTKQSGAGAKAFDMSMDLALKFNLDPQEAVRSVHSLISKGFTGDEAKILLTAMADLRVLSPNANLDKVSLAIEQIKGKGKLQMEELQGQLAEAGVSTSLVLDQLAKKYKKSSDAIRKMISAGQIDAKEGVQAIVDAITAMGTGKLGEAAENAARNSLSGLVGGFRTRLAMLPIEMAKKLDGSTGIELVKGALRNVLDALDPTKSPAMVKLIASASGFATSLFTALFGDTASADAGATLQKIIQGVADGFDVLTTVVQVVGPVISALLGGAGESLGAWYDGLKEAAAGVSEAFGGDKTAMVQAVASAARNVGRVLATVVVVVGLVAGAFVGLTASAAAAMATVMQGFVAVLAVFDRIIAAIRSVSGEMSAAGLLSGNALWQGLTTGILAGVDPVNAAGSQLGNAAKSGVDTSLKIQSPSKVMEERGEFTGEGFIRGTENMQADVDAAMNRLVAPQAGGVSGGSTSTSTLNAGGIHMPVTIIGASEADGKSFASGAGGSLLDQLDDWVAQLGLNPSPSPG
jgi:tape measure domain-containing protein